METHERSFLKALTWRFLASLTTVILVLVFTGDLTLAGTVGVFDITSKLLIYYAHERAWDRVDWGRDRHRRKSARHR